MESSFEQALVRSDPQFKALGMNNGRDDLESRCRLTPRWSARVKDKVPNPNAGVRAAQLNR